MAVRLTIARRIAATTGIASMSLGLLLLPLAGGRAAAAASPNASVSVVGRLAHGEH